MTIAPISGSRDDPDLLAFLRSRFSYDPDTGLISGETGEVGWRFASGDCFVSARGFGTEEPTHWHAARVAFALHTGEIPGRVTTVNGKADDLRWCNLRKVSTLPRRDAPALRLIPGSAISQTPPQNAFDQYALPGFEDLPLPPRPSWRKSRRR